MPTEALILLVVFVVLLGLGVPIAFSLGLSTLAALLMIDQIGPAGATITAQQIKNGTDSFVLLAIPFFILAGQIMNRGGIAARIIAFARATVGMLPGGLAFVNIMSAMLFGALSGSAVAAASAIGTVMTPQMESDGYDRPFCAAVNITSSTTGLVIPPSNVLIVYSLVGGVSVAGLFVAGYLPGILVGVTLMIVAGVIAKRRGFPTAGRVPLREALRCFVAAAPSLGMIVVVIGGIVGGVFTATEAAAGAGLYALILAAIYREIELGALPAIFRDSAATTGVVLLLVGTSTAMGWVLGFQKVPESVGEALLLLSDDRIAILAIINVTLLAVGIFMDITPAVLIFTPIFLPVVTQLGVDPTHFGIMMVLNLCIGLCTPPVGSVLFVGCSVAKVPIAKVIRPMLPFYLAMLAVLIVVTYVPALSLWLPGLLEGGP